MNKNKTQIKTAIIVADAEPIGSVDYPQFGWHIQIQRTSVVLFTPPPIENKLIFAFIIYYFSYVYATKIFSLNGFSTQKVIITKKKEFKYQYLSLLLLSKSFSIFHPSIMHIDSKSIQFCLCISQIQIIFLCLFDWTCRSQYFCYDCFQITSNML